MIIVTGNALHDKPGVRNLHPQEFQALPDGVARFNSLLTEASREDTWIAITSKRTCDFVEIPAEIRVAAVGQGTARAFLAVTGRIPDFIGPEPSSGKTLAKNFPLCERVIHPASSLASFEFAERLGKREIEAIDVAVYEPTTRPEFPAELAAELDGLAELVASGAPEGEGKHFVVVTSPSAMAIAEPILRGALEKLPELQVVVLGEPTANSTELPVTIVAPGHLSMLLEKK